MAWIQSSKISVFPTTRRAIKQQDARLMTEKSLVGIINQLIDKDAFIVTKKDSVASDKPFEFNIKGYLFHFDKLSDITDLYNTSTNLEIYAYIVLDTGNGYTELLGQDDTLSVPDEDAYSIYKGVTFSDVPVSGTNTYCLKILQRTDITASWICPETSYYKYIGSTIDFSIDGGIIS